MTWTLFIRFRALGPGQLCLLKYYIQGFYIGRAPTEMMQLKMV